MESPHQPPVERGQHIPAPGAPLYPLSQDQVNKSFSTSVRGIDEQSSRHMRTSSDVQGKVQQFNRLAQESLEKKRMQEAALKRAIVGREEAENEMRRAKEQLKVMEKELQRAKRKEKEAIARCEDAEHQLDQERGLQQKSSHSYEKEIRKISKEAFRSSSKLVTLQEDLKSSRDALKASENENEKKLAALHQLAKESSANSQKASELQSRVATLDERVLLLESENGELKKAIEEQELLRIAAEGRLALPKDDQDLLEPETEPKETPESALKEENEAATTTEACPAQMEPVQQTIIVEVERAPVRNEWGLTAEEDLREQVESLRDQLKDREDTIEFMQIECQFRCCSCRISEDSGHQYVFDPRVTSDSVATAVKANLDGLNHKIAQGVAQIKSEGRSGLSKKDQKNKAFRPTRFSVLPKPRETIIDPFAAAAPWWNDENDTLDAKEGENITSQDQDAQLLADLKSDEAEMEEARTPEWQEEEDRYACKQRAIVIYLTKPRAETTEEELDELRQAAYERELQRAELARASFKGKYDRDWDASNAPVMIQEEQQMVSEPVDDMELDLDEPKEANEEMTLVLPQHLNNISATSSDLLPAPVLTTGTTSTSHPTTSQKTAQTPSRSVSTPAPKAILVPTGPPATVAHAPPSPLSNSSRSYHFPPASSILLPSLSDKAPFQHLNQQAHHQLARGEHHHKRSISAEGGDVGTAEQPLPRKVPLRQPFEDIGPSTPKTMSREAALQAIKERRDRARSVGRKPARLF